RLTWSVRQAGGTWQEVGTGTSVADVRLGVEDTCGARADWTVRLRVEDGAGLVDLDTVDVTVLRVCPQ
ncbi:MAG: hypothetical protein R3185_04565, partial [Candidatus Thermoplasmatota archaeon]|nr:hypothetical protein [Candidatus Thermoplasmatota archaeon]